MSKEYIVGVDIGGTHIRIGAMDDALNMEHFFKRNRREVMFGANAVEKLLAFLREYRDRCLTDGRIKAVAAGFPSTINRERTRLISTPNIEGLNNVEIASVLSEGLGIPVYPERDVSMLFYHDRHRYGLPDAGTVIACYIGTGIGNVICINGRLLTGADGVAGELGHIPVLGREEPCTCGNPGCIENYGSGRYLESVAAKCFGGVAIQKIFREEAEEPAIREFIENVSVPIAAEINILNPDRIVLGGGVLAMESFPRELLEEHIRRHTRKPLPERNLHFIYSENSDTGGVIGAALYAKSRLEAKETVS